MNDFEDLDELDDPFEISLLESNEDSQLRIKNSNGDTNYLHGHKHKLLDYAQYWVKGVGANKGNKPFSSEANLWKQYWEEITKNEVNKLELNRLHGLIYYISTNTFRFTYHQVINDLRVVWVITYRTQDGYKVPNLSPLIIIWKGDWYATTKAKPSELKKLLTSCRDCSELELKDTLVFRYILREKHSSVPNEIKRLDPYTKIWNVNIPSWYDLAYKEHRNLYSSTNDLNIGLNTTISKPKPRKKDFFIRVISLLIGVSLILNPIHQELKQLDIEHIEPHDRRN
jgi:hypothetical protein